MGQDFHIHCYDYNLLEKIIKSNRHPSKIAIANHNFFMSYKIYYKIKNLAECYHIEEFKNYMGVVCSNGNGKDVVEFIITEQNNETLELEDELKKKWITYIFCILEDLIHSGKPINILNILKRTEKASYEVSLDDIIDQLILEYSDQYSTQELIYYINEILRGPSVGKIKYQNILELGKNAEIFLTNPHQHISLLKNPNISGFIINENVDKEFYSELRNTKKQIVHGSGKHFTEFPSIYN